MVKEVMNKPPAGSAPAAIDLYAVSDPIPVPEAIESDSDAAWALWERSLSAPNGEPDTTFEPTVPAVLTPLAPLAPLKSAKYRA